MRPAEGASAGAGDPMGLKEMEGPPEKKKKKKKKKNTSPVLALTTPCALGKLIFTDI